MSEIQCPDWLSGGPPEENTDVRFTPGVANKVGCRSMRDSRAKRLDVIPSVEGVMTRLAFACAQGKGADVDSLLRKAGLSRTQIEGPHIRISVRSQVVFV